MSLTVQAEIHDRFEGFARIRLSDIEFNTAQDLDERHVARLEEIYKAEGCRRDDPANAIPVVLRTNVIAELRPKATVGLTHRSPA